MGKYCGNCGTPMAQDEKFCAICGTKFESNIKTVKTYSKKQLTAEVIKKERRRAMTATLLSPASAAATSAGIVR